MIARIITYANDQIGLLCAQPNWDSEVTVSLDIPTDVSKEPITFYESRRNFAQSARYSMKWTTYMPDTASATDLRLFLTRLRGEPVAVPLWTDACELSAVEGIGSTSLQTIDAPVRSGTLWIIANDTFDSYEIVTVTGITGSAGAYTITISPGTTRAWAIGDRMWPLMFGRFPERPQAEALSDESFEVELTIKENSDFSKRLSTMSGTIPTVGSHIPTFSSTPLFNYDPNYVRPVDWTEMPDITYQQIGFLRQEQQREYDHRNTRGLELEFYECLRDDLANIERFFRDRRANTLRFMIPTWKGDMRMSQNTPYGPDPKQIYVEDSEFADAGREAQPGDPYIALIDSPSNVIDPYQLSGTRSTLGDPGGGGWGNLDFNLISYWEMDDPAEIPTIWLDSKGTNHLSTHGSPRKGLGKIATAVDLEMTSGDYLYCADNGSLQTGDIDFTFAAWIKFESTLNDRTILGKWVVPGSYEYQLLYSRADFRLKFSVSPDGTAVVSVNADAFGIPTTGIWYYVVCWHDSVNNQIGIQVNNGTANTTSHSGGVFTGAGWPAGMDTNLISYWKLDETSSTRIDSFGSNHLTDNNTVGSATGKINNAASFVATSSERLSIASNSSLQMGNIDFTISAWVNLSSKGATRQIVGKRAVLGGSLEYYLRYETSTDRFNFEVSSNGSTVSSVNANNFGSPSTGTWYFVVCWHDSVNDQIAIQVNNGAANATSYSTGVFAGVSEFNIGAHGGPGEYWDGLIDEVALWKRVLTPTEKTSLYNGGAGLPYGPSVTLSDFGIGFSPFRWYWDGLIDEVGFWKRILTTAEKTELYNGSQGMVYQAPPRPAMAPGTILLSTVNVSAHTASSTIVSHLLLARFLEATLEWSYITPYHGSSRIKFLELPHEYFAPPAALMEPAYLFIFVEAGVRTDRYTSYENTIVIASGAYAGTYVPAPFSFDEVTTGLKLDQEKITLKSFPFTGNPLGKMWPFALDGVLTVEVVEVNAAAPSSTGAIIHFSGDLWNVNSDYQAEAIAFGNLFERRFPRFLLSVSDNYTQFSPPTNIVHTSYETTGTLPSVIDVTDQTIDVTSSAGQAKANNYYAGGWLETGTGDDFERRGILDSSPGSGSIVHLHIDRPIIKANGNQSVKFYPGYDGSITECASKFSNRINFGGHPYIPNVNPAVRAMKQKDVAGGKKT